MPADRTTRREYVTLRANAVFPDMGPYPANDLVDAVDLVAELLRRLTAALGNTESLTNVDDCVEFLTALGCAAERLPDLIVELSNRFADAGLADDRTGVSQRCHAATVAAVLLDTGVAPTTVDAARLVAETLGRIETMLEDAPPRTESADGR